MLHDRNTIHVPSHVIPAHAAVILSLPSEQVRHMIDRQQIHIEHWQGFEYIPMCEVIRVLNEREEHGCTASNG